MKTDRELLELAAKAAGYSVWRQSEGVGGALMLEHPGYSRDASRPWNPLTDDGDALRMAVKLHVSVLSNETTSWIAHGMGQVNIAEESHDGTDPYAATRRAIVRAAAAIWEAMPA